MWTSGPRAGRRIRRPRIRAPSSRPRTPPGRGSRRRTDPRRPAASAAPLALTNRRMWTSRCRRPSRRRPGLPRLRLRRLLRRCSLRRCSLRRSAYRRPVGEPVRMGVPWRHPGVRPPTAWDRPWASDNPTAPGPGLPIGLRRRPGQGGGGFPRWPASRRRRPTTPRGRHRHRTAHGPRRQLGCRWIPQATDGSRSARHRSVLPRPSGSAVPRQAAACPDPIPRSRSLPRLLGRGDSRGRQTAGVR